MDLTERIETVRRDMAAEPVRLCPERAYLITKFAKEHDDPSEPVVVRQAQALAYLLERKQTIIFPGELIVGNAGTSRKCCIMQPELASAFMSQELLWIDRRKTNPFEISLADRLRLITRVLPYWMRRSMPSRMFSNPVAMARYMKHQMNPTFYLINEAGGIGHFLPDYEKMLKLGTRGYVNSIKGKRGDLHKAARIVCQALDTWAGRMADEADRQAEILAKTLRKFA